MFITLSCRRQTFILTERELNNLNKNVATGALIFTFISQTMEVVSSRRATDPFVRIQHGKCHVAVLNGPKNGCANEENDKGKVIQG